MSAAGHGSSSSGRRGAEVGTGRADGRGSVVGIVGRGVRDVSAEDGVPVIAGSGVVGRRIVRGRSGSVVIEIIVVSRSGVVAAGVVAGVMARVVLGVSSVGVCGIPGSVGGIVDVVRAVDTISGVVIDIVVVVRHEIFVFISYKIKLKFLVVRLSLAYILFNSVLTLFELL